MLVYLIRNLVNQRCYIGKTSHTLAFRWRQHKTEARIGRYDWPLYREMRQYGTEQFEIVVLREVRVMNRKQLAALEKKFIVEYQAMESDGGYNQDEHSRGGRDRKPKRRSVGVPLPPEHRERIRASVLAAIENRRRQQQGVSVTDADTDTSFEVTE